MKLAVDSKEYRSPAVFFINGIGDNVLALPALRALSQLWPGRITLVCGPEAATDFFGELAPRQIVRIALSRSERGPDFPVDVVSSEIRDCDVLVLLVPWRSGAMDMLCTRFRPKPIVGFGHNCDVAADTNYSLHSARMLFEVVRLLEPSASVDEYLEPLQFSAATNAAVDRVLGSGLVRRPYVAVHCDTAAEKMWPLDRMMQVLQECRRLCPRFSCVVVGAPDAALVHAAVVTLHDDGVTSCLGLPLAVSQCLVARADAFLGVDSCHLHVADLAQVRSIGLFGPTRSQQYGFLRAPHTAFQASDMDRIQGGEVLTALVETLGSGR